MGPVREKFLVGPAMNKNTLNQRLLGSMKAIGCRRDSAMMLESLNFQV
jgi:hypothetical protein